MTESLSQKRRLVRPGNGGDDASPNGWKRHLQEAFRSRSELLSYLELSNDSPSAEADEEFPMLVPKPFASRMKKGDPEDPLLLQVLAQPVEKLDPTSETDAVGDLAAIKTPGLLHKYHGRVLLIIAGSCAVNCRYCFRRHFPYQQALRSKKSRASAIEYLRSDSSIHEVILSGGDPLMLQNSELAQLLEEIESIDHIDTVRVHTRLPIMIPARINPFLTGLFENSRLSSVFVLHTNHANEISQEVESACRMLSGAGTLLLNQTVLLRGVNDSLQKLRSLSSRLLSANVLPYYLHKLDIVKGVSHFYVSTHEGTELIRRMRDSMPGYLVPRYVSEEPGGPSKIVIK